jgi:RNA-splicing ligase RtcB
MVRRCLRECQKKTVKNVFKNIPEGTNSVGKPRKRWLDDVENYVKKTRVRGWKKLIVIEDAWTLILKEANVLHGR